jgi:hypothetical protein
MGGAADRQPPAVDPGKVRHGDDREPDGDGRGDSSGPAPVRHAGHGHGGVRADVLGLGAVVPARCALHADAGPDQLPAGPDRGGARDRRGAGPDSGRCLDRPVRRPADVSRYIVCDYRAGPVPWPGRLPLPAGHAGRWLLPWAGGDVVRGRGAVRRCDTSLAACTRTAGTDGPVGTASNAVVAQAPWITAAPAAGSAAHSMRPELLHERGGLTCGSQGNG